NKVTFLVQAATGGSLQITTGSLPAGTSGGFYSTTLAASGGQSPYSWALAPGSQSLPPGLTLFNNGQISGTPSVAGTSNINVRVTDSASNVADRALALTINAGSGFRLNSPSRPSKSRFQFNFNTVAGSNYTIQSS